MNGTYIALGVVFMVLGTGAMTRAKTVEGATSGAASATGKGIQLAGILFLVAGLLFLITGAVAE